LIACACAGIFTKDSLSSCTKEWRKKIYSLWRSLH
jgi:hypothetical protein